MMQDKSNWTDVVRRTLGEAEEPLPYGGWERLEHELGGVAPQRVAITSYRYKVLKFAAAAAVVLVCVSIGVRILRSDRNVLKRVVVVSEAAVSEQNTDLESVRLSESVDLAASSEQLTQTVRPFVTTTSSASSSLHAQATNDAMVVVLASTATPSTLHSNTLSSAEAPVEALTLSQADDTVDALLAEALTADAIDREEVNEVLVESKTSYTTADYDGLFAQVQSVDNSSGSVGLHAAGVITSSESNSRGGASNVLLISDDDGAVMLRRAYEEYSYKHKQPISFGLTFRKELKYGLSLESGVTYTLLRSNVVMPGVVRDVKQTLHMIGIPLRLNWEFLRRGRFSLYAGVGGLAEKCVSARFGSENINEPKVQWALFGAIGAQYKISRTIGVYFEPEVSHYMTQTTLRTSYTDSKINLNLQLGVRFNY